MQELRGLVHEITVAYGAGATSKTGEARPRVAFTRRTYPSARCGTIPGYSGRRGGRRLAWCASPCPPLRCRATWCWDQRRSCPTLHRRCKGGPSSRLVSYCFRVVLRSNLQPIAQCASKYQMTTYAKVSVQVYVLVGLCPVLCMCYRCSILATGDRGQRLWIRRRWRLYRTARVCVCVRVCVV